MKVPPSSPRNNDLYNDGISTSNAVIQQELKCAIEETRAILGDGPQVREGLNEISEALDEGVSLRLVCRLRQALEKQLSTEEQAQLAPVMTSIYQKVEAAISALRDPSVPLYPTTIIPHETHLYNGEPWYIAGFEYDDILSGTTGGPHLAYIRMPKKIDSDGEDFPATFFADQKNLWGDDPVMVRMHSECLLGDIAVSQARCDCGEQFRMAMDRINERGKGALLYLRQEGRGVGLKEKFPLLELADGRSGGKWVGQDFNTETAMYAKGHETMDYRDYRFVAKIMRGIGLENIELISGNPAKIRMLQQSGINVTPTSKEATGVAITVENLLEFLVKIIRGYAIPWPSIIEVQHHIQSLYDGKKIDDRLFDLLCDMLAYASNANQNNVPPELTKLLNGVKHRLVKRDTKDV